MINFKYKVKTKSGDTKIGNVDAINRDAAIGILHRKGYVIISVKKMSPYSLGNLPFFGKVKKSELVIFSRQVSLLMQAKVPLVQALIAVSRQMEGSLKLAIIEITEDIRGGLALSKTLEKHKYIFPELYINIVKLGEVSGTLDRSFEYLAGYYEKQYNLEKTLKGAMIYPALVLTFFFGIALAMTIFVIPSLAILLEDLGQELPFVTRFLISYNNFLLGYWWLVILLITVIISGLIFYVKTKQGRLLKDRLKLKLPIIGPMLQKVYITRFSEGLSTMIKGGLPIVKGMQIVAESVGNEVYKDLFIDVSKKVQEGSTITAVFLSSEEIPPIVAQMVSVGEKIGKLDVSLDFLASFYTREVENVLNNLQDLLVPFVMVFLAVMIGFFALSILLPIYSVYNAL